MRLTTIICAAAFLFFIVHGRFDFSGLSHMGRCGPCEASEPAPAKADGQAKELRAIDRKIRQTGAIIERLERSEKRIARRIEEVRKAERRQGRSGAIVLSRDSADVASLIAQLGELKEEQESAHTLLERLKTERVRLEVRHDLQRTAADRKAIGDFGPGSAGDGPVERLSRQLDTSDELTEGGIRYEVF